MKKILLTLAVLVSLSSSAFAAIGYVDYETITSNYTLAKKYTSDLDRKVASIESYAKQKQAEIDAQKVDATKTKMRKDAITAIEVQKKEMSALTKRYESDLVIKVAAASEKIRVQKKLDAIIKSSAHITGGVNCTNEVLNLLNMSSLK